MSITQNQIRTSYTVLATVSNTEPPIYNQQGKPLFNLGDSYYNSTTYLIHTVIQETEDVPMHWGAGETPVDYRLYCDLGTNTFYGCSNGELFARVGSGDITNPLSANLDANNHFIRNLPDAEDLGDAVNKKLLDTKANITDVILSSEKGAANGVATLDANGKVTSTQLALPIASTTTAGITKPDGITLNTSIDGTMSVVDTSFYKPNLLEFKWSDHLFNNISWLRGDTFSWQDGSVYTAVYNHLVDDYNNTPSTITAPSGTIYVRDLYRDYYNDSTMTQYYAWYNSEASDYTTVYTTSVFPHIDVTSVYRRSSSTFTNLGKVTAANVFTEIIGDCSIECKVASDGHKIALANQETIVQNIFNESGVAWYYILDTANTRFKLPRTKWNFVGLRDAVGKYVPESLPDGAIQLSNENGGADGTMASGAGLESYWAKLSDFNSVFQENAPVQQRATQMYLYFYVGNFSQSATEQTAGLNSELFNGKADVDLSNITSYAKKVVFAREFTPLNTTIATGGFAISGEYTLTDLPNDNVIRLGLFEVTITLTQDGYSSMALQTDVMSSASVSASTNNMFGAAHTTLLPIKNKITISFPEIGGGLSNYCSLKLKGYI